MLHAVVTAHQAVDVWLVAGCAALGTWGTLSFATRRRVSGRYRLAFLALVGLIILQGLVAVATLVAGDRRAGWTHLVYGAVGLLLLGGPYLWAARGTQEREAATLAVVCWLGAIAFGEDLTSG
ncbi:MAG: hypothetical protein WAM30_06580 [Candidatus Dormiibacterota bacterium]